MTKHKLVRYLPKVGAIVVSATVLLSSCAKQEEDKFLSFSESNNNVATEEIVDNIYYHSFEKTPFDFMFNCLVKKHFAKKDQSNIILSDIKINGEKKYFLKFQEISSDKIIPEFFNKLIKFYDIEILQIDSSTLWQLNDFKFSYINTLVINNEGNSVGMCDLANFEKIDNLVLKNVRATNIPSNVQSICFDGNNNNLYVLDEIDNLKSFSELKSLIFKNLSLNSITIPPSDEFLLEITDCKGYIKVNVSNSNKVYIDNCTSDEFNCFIEVSGTINEELNAYSSFDNVVVGEVKGNPSLTMTIHNNGNETIKTIENADEYKLKLQKNN